jgi:hypothetical protein
MRRGAVPVCSTLQARLLEVPLVLMARPQVVPRQMLAR